MNRITLFALLALAASGTAAQQVTRPDPADTKAGAPMRPAYESPFRDYRPYADPEVGRWREVNQEMGRLNGHVGHVPGSAPPSAKGAEGSSKPPAHGGHK